MYQMDVGVQKCGNTYHNTEMTETPWSGRQLERLWRENCWEEYMLREELARFIPKRDTLLDVGCGNGKMEEHLPDTEYTGLDWEPDLQPDVVSSSTDLPFDDNSFDVVICKNHLQHVPEWYETVDEMVRVASNAVAIFDRCCEDGTELMGKTNYGVHLIKIDIADLNAVLEGVDVWGWSEINSDMALFIKHV